jgi:hypothetical protein
MIRRGLWAFITQDDEDEARRKLKALDERAAPGNGLWRCADGRNQAVGSGNSPNAHGPTAREEQMRIRRLVRESLRSAAPKGPAPIERMIIVGVAQSAGSAIGDQGGFAALLDDDYTAGLSATR